MLLNFDYRIKKSLVSYKVYEKIKMRLQMENNRSFS